MGSTELFLSGISHSQSGFHVAYSAPWSRRGDPRSWRDFLDIESAPRGPRGEDEAEPRDRQVPGRLPVVRGERRRPQPGKAVAETARRSKNTILLCYTRFPFGVCVTWNLKGDASWGKWHEGNRAVVTAYKIYVGWNMVKNQHDRRSSGWLLFVTLNIIIFKTTSWAGQDQLFNWPGTVSVRFFEFWAENLTRASL